MMIKTSMKYKKNKYKLKIEVITYKAGTTLHINNHKIKKVKLITLK